MESLEKVYKKTWKIALDLVEGDDDSISTFRLPKKHRGKHTNRVRKVVAMECIRQRMMRDIEALDA